MNLGLRGFALAGKFLLLVVVARFLSAGALGVYGVVGSTVGLGIYLLGLEFHLYNTREIIGSDPETRGRNVRDQFVLHGITHLLLLPWFGLLFFVDLIGWQHAAFFFVILILEHVCQELYRILVALGRPVRATLVHVFRGGAWVYAFAAVVVWWPETRRLATLWLGWIGGGFTSLVLGAWFLRDLPIPSLARSSVDWGWVRKGVKVSALFLVSAVCLRGIVAVDRYALRHFFDTRTVGIYTFFMSIAQTLRMAVDTGITIVVLPKVIEAFQAGEMDRYGSLMRKMSASMVGGVLLLVGVAAVGIYPVLALVGEPAYGEHLATYHVLLAAMGVAVVGLVPHYALYARGLDRPIVGGAAAGLAVAVVGNLVLVPIHGGLGAAVATLLSFVVIALAKGGSLAWLVARRRGRALAR